MVYARDHRSSNRDSQDEAPQTTGLFPSRSLSDRAKQDFRPPVPDAHVERTKKLNPRFNRSFAHIPVRNLGNPPPAFDRAQMTIQAQTDDSSDKATIASSWADTVTSPQAISTKQKAKLEIESLSPIEAVDFLWKQPKKFHKALVIVRMKQKDDFIKELATDEGGRKLLESIVNTSVSAYIPDIAHLFNVLTPAGTTSHPWLIQKPVGVLGIPLALVAGTLKGIQHLIGMGWTKTLSNHRAWIKELIRQEFDVEFQGSWSEADLRKTYKAFHMLPQGTVRTTVDKLTREFGFGSSASEDIFSGERSINMASMLPTAITMGSFDPSASLFGGTFLKQDSKYSDRMKWKNAWTEALIHEVGHTVDFKRRVMDRHGHKREFGNWKKHKTKTLADAMLAVCKDVPQVTWYTFEEDQEIQQLDAEIAEKKGIYNSSTPEDYEGDYYFDVKAPAATAMISAQEEKEALEKKVSDRTWLASHPVTRSMLKDAITAAANKKDSMKAVKKNGDFAGMSPPEKAAARTFIKAHPAVKMAKANVKLGAWERNDSTMEAMAEPFKGRYFQCSYPGDGNKTDRNDEWVSFDVSSRKVAVSNYQYRAPSEWFAELYAHYYLGTLQGHPLYDWFEREIDVEMDPDTVLGAPATPNAEDLKKYNDALQ